MFLRLAVVPWGRMRWWRDAAAVTVRDVDHGEQTCATASSEPLLASSRPLTGRA